MVRRYRTFSNDLSSGETKCAGCKLHRFGEVQAPRTSSNLFTGVQGGRESAVEPNTPNVWGGSSTSNLLEPFRTKPNQRVASVVTGVRGGSTVPNLL